MFASSFSEFSESYACTFFRELVDTVRRSWMPDPHPCSSQAPDGGEPVDSA